MRLKTLCLSLVALLLLAGVAMAGTAYYLLTQPSHDQQQTLELYIDEDDTPDSVACKLHAQRGARMLLCSGRYQVRTGYYQVPVGEKALRTFRRLRGKEQTPVNVTVPAVRTVPRMATALSRQLMVDSASVMAAIEEVMLADSVADEATVLALFLPDTYQCYWDAKATDFVGRLLREHRQYWQGRRTERAQQLGLTPVEVCTLASIVDEETNYNPEKPRVAGLYLNRLRRNMPLQADPTVKFAVGDFALRRILNKHLAVESPYNTYIHAGLPPGPIRIASKVAIDAVLEAEKHDYLYMCAKEDFSGSHNFAANYAQHLQNARRYTRALNERGIK